LISYFYRIQGDLFATDSEHAFIDLIEYQLHRKLMCFFCFLMPV